MSENNIIIFSDGASKGNPGSGGWGAVVVTPEKVVEIGGAEKNTTNNRMELRAAIEGLKIIAEQKGAVTVYTDSRYVVNGITKWVYSWEKRNWITTQKEAVLNRDLWEDLISLVRNRGAVEWKYLGGHIGIAGNERVDEIASKFAEGKLPELWAGPLKKYSIDILNFDYDETKKDAKKSSSSRSAMKAYSYISKVGGVVQIHKTWKECEARVRGAKGALYKKATSPEEEEEIIKSFER